jgi:hypothetical protein
LPLPSSKEELLDDVEDPHQRNDAHDGRENFLEPPVVADDDELLATLAESPGSPWSRATGDATASEKDR